MVYKTSLISGPVFYTLTQADFKAGSPALTLKKEGLALEVRGDRYPIPLEAGIWHLGFLRLYFEGVNGTKRLTSQWQHWWPSV